MGCKAVLTRVNDKDRVLAKLPEWTDDDPNEIVADVENGQERVITTSFCQNCKVELEKEGAADVRVEESAD